MIKLNLRRFLVGVVWLALWVTTAVAQSAPPPMILVIDGFDKKVYDPTGLLWKTPGRVVSYLMPEIKASWGEFWDLKESENLYYVIWGGDPTSTKLAVGTAKVDIQQLLYAKTESQPLVIVTHSWGSVIAYRAIVDLSKEGILKPGDVDTFISMGSPLNTQSRILRAITRPLYQWSDPAPAANAVRQWHNYYIESDDWISGPIPGTHPNVTNIPLPYTGPDDTETAHNAYHKDLGFLRQIGMELRDALALPSPETKLTSPMSAAPPPPAGDAANDVVYGMTLSALTPQMRDFYQVPQEIRGVIITGVLPSGVAANEGLCPGHVIIEVQQEPVTNPADAIQKMTRERDLGYSPTLLIFLPDRGDYHWLHISPRTPSLGACPP